MRCEGGEVCPDRGFGAPFAPLPGAPAVPLAPIGTPQAYNFEPFQQVNFHRGLPGFGEAIGHWTFEMVGEGHGHHSQYANRPSGALDAFWTDMRGRSGSNSSHTKVSPLPPPPPLSRHLTFPLIFTLIYSRSLALVVSGSLALARRWTSF